jgi:hypothetical protein
VTFTGGFLKLSKLDTTPGNDKMLFKGTMTFTAGVPAIVDPATRGAQIRIDDLGAGGSAIYDLTSMTHPIPPGGGGTGCGPTDGWKTNQPRTKQIYKNSSGAVDVGVCTNGSANGFSLMKVKDRRGYAAGIQIRAKARNATMPHPVGPLRITVVLGATAAAGNAGECATFAFSPTSCQFNSSGTTLICR